jgi:hypothetical protein
MPVRDKLHAVAGLTDWKRRFETLQNELEMIFRIVERKVAILDGERHGSLYRTAKVFVWEPILLAARSLVEALLNQYEQDFQDLETAKYDIKASIKAAEAAQAEHEKKRKEAYAAGCAYQDKAWTDRYSETIQQHFDRGRREEYDNWQKYQDGIRAECRKTVEKEYDLHAIQAQRESWQEAETKYKSEIKGQNDQLAAKMGELARAKENHASNLTTELSAAEENLKKEHAKAVEEVNKTHKTEVEELKTSHSQVVRSVQDKHTATMLDRDGYKNDYEDGVREIQEHKKKIEKLEKGRDEDKRGREEDKRRHDEDKARTTRRHGEEIGRYETRLDQVKQDHTTRMGAQTTRHREDTNRLQQLHDVNIAEMQRNIDQMQSDHKFDQELLKKEFVAKMTSQEQQHDQRVSAMETTHATVVQRLETAHTSTRTRFELEISKLKQEHATELKSLEQRYMQKVSQMKTAYAAHVETLQTKHAEAHIGLKEQVQSYSGALLTRDIRDFTMLEMEDMKYLSDSDIKTRFELLKQEVDTLSRVEWKPNPKHWTNQIVKRLSSNQRVLRKQILQDSIWSLLHNFVFCSPFRLFGEEGETLEKQWNERCGKGRSSDFQVGSHQTC